MMELILALADRRPHRLRRLAAAAAAHLPGHHRPVADLLCGQSVHLRDGPVAERGGTDPCKPRSRRSRALRRSAAAGPGSDRHRHQLRDDGPVPRGAAGLARPDGYRPCRRTGGRPSDIHDRPSDRRADPAAAGLRRPCCCSWTSAAVPSRAGSGSRPRLRCWSSPSSCCAWPTCLLRGRTDRP